MVSRVVYITRDTACRRRPSIQPSSPLLEDPYDFVDPDQLAPIASPAAVAEWPADP